MVKKISMGSAAPAPRAAKNNPLTAALQSLGLGQYGNELMNLGVSTPSDVLELEMDDLKGIGLSLVQIRKLQNACKGGGGGGAPKVQIQQAGGKAGGKGGGKATIAPPWKKTPTTQPVKVSTAAIKQPLKTPFLKTPVTQMAAATIKSAATKAAVSNMSKLSTAVPRCDLNHMMKPTKADHGGYKCDKCSKMVPLGQSVYSCRTCDFDVCAGCCGRGEKNGTAAKMAPASVGAADCKWCASGECWTHQKGKGGAPPGGKGAAPPGGGLRKITNKKPAAPRKPFKRSFIEFNEAEFDMDAAEEQRGELSVAIDGGPAGTTNYHPPVTTFEEIEALPPFCVEALNNMGITEPMPIQAQAIPIVLSGEDLVGVAKTGSGKTLAYLLPAVVHIEAQDPIGARDLSPIVCCLAPTRELAVQIQEEAEKLLSCSAEGSNHPGGLKACCIFGGMKKDGQLALAYGAHIMAATPGRLYDHVTRGDISMDRCTYFVLDEGDRMLEEGFGEHVQTIGNAIRPDRHMLFFSATWPLQVHRLAKAMCKGKKAPVRLRVGQNTDGTAKTRDDIVQEVVVFDDGDWDERDAAKKELLYEHVKAALEMEETKVLVFVSRKDLADGMCECFAEEGYASEAMHGGRSQHTRLDVLERFKNGDARLLVTTDVMGRGLDIPTITHVVCYDMGDIEDYVHRIGRTARGPHGEGHALTFFEYDPRWPHLAEGLVKILEGSNQDVPDELRQIASDVEDGSRQTKKMKGAWGKLSGEMGGHGEIEKAKYGAGASKMFAKW